MTWNYRVVHRREADEDIYAVHEAYYEGDKATTITVNPVYPQRSTPDELREDCDAYQKALKQPVLEYESFSSKKESA